MGACRVNEMYNMKTTDLTDFGSAFLIKVPQTKIKVTKKFTVTKNFYHIIKKYVDCRPTHCKHNVFFLSYQKGRCSTQRIGINKFTQLARDIAIYLNLPDVEKFTGHSFRRSSKQPFLQEEEDET